MGVTDPMHTMANVGVVPVPAPLQEPYYAVLGSRSDLQCSVHRTSMHICIQRLDCVIHTCCTPCAKVAVSVLGRPRCNVDVQLGKIGCQGWLCVGVTCGQLSAVDAATIVASIGRHQHCTTGTPHQTGVKINGVLREGLCRMLSKKQQ